MSLSTALIGGVGGAIIGFFTGGATGALQGLQVGTFVGGLIDQAKSPKIVGPRLSDLTVQTSTYGAVIPRAYGTVGIHGNIFWLENNQLKEVATKSKSGGKGSGGGSEYETYAYYATFALGLCRCPTTPAIGIKRIWIKDILWYDAGSSDYNSIRVNNANSSLFTFHNGSDTQLPDARMQATLGVANTPAYRGIAYIVFKDLPLRNYGNSLAGAQIKVEIVSNGSVQEFVNQSVGHGLPAATDIVWDGNQFIAINQGANSNLYSTSPDGVTWTVRSCPGAEGPSAVGSIGSNGKITLACWSYQTGVWKTTNGRTWTQVTTSGDFWSFGKVGNKIMMFPREYNGSPSISEDGKLWLPAGELTPYGSFPENMPVANDKYAVAVTHYRQLIYVYDISMNAWGTYPMPPGAGFTSGFSTVVWMPNIGKWMFMAQGGKVGLTTDFKNWEVNNGPAGGWAPLTYTNGKVYTQTNTTTIYYTSDGVNWSTRPLSPALVMTGICFNEGVTIFQGVSSSIRSYENAISTTIPTLRSVIEAECSLSKLLQPSDIDTTLLSGSVKGYVVSSVAALRSSLAPLQGKFQFDVVQSGYKLKFKPRGGTSVVTIPASDLGAEGIR